MTTPQPREATTPVTLTYAYTDVNGDTTTETIDFADRALAVSWAVTIRAAFGPAFVVTAPADIVAFISGGATTDR